MAVVPWLPALCSACSLTRLLPVEPGQVRTEPCRSCGGQCSVLPGEMYAENDAPLFARIEASLRAMVLSPRTLQQVLAQVKNVTGRAGSPEQALLRVIDILPPLHFLLPELGLESRPARERTHSMRACGMVMAIVGARLRRLE